MNLLLIAVNYNNKFEISAFLDKLKANYPLEHTVVIDDASSDGSDRIAAQKGFSLLQHQRNKGIGAAIRTGILHAHQKQYDGVIIMSCNGKMEPAEIPAIIKPIKEGIADYVQGNRRYSKEKSFTIFRRFAAPLFSLGGSIFLGRYFSDLTCGFRAYKLHPLLSKINLENIKQEWLNQYELEYYIHYWACKHKLRIVEVPVTISYSHLPFERKSKIKPFIGWYSMIRPFILLGLGLKK